MTWSPGEACAALSRAWPKSSACSYGRPSARVAWPGHSLGALEDEARRLGYSAARLDTGPKQVHALALYRSAGYVDVPAYNDNPFACFWGEKALR